MRGTTLGPHGPGTAGARGLGVELFSHTHARRFPPVLGKINGWTIPWPIGPLTMPQVGAIALSGSVLLITKPVWGHFGLWNWLVILGVPAALGWVVRASRIEGRSPLFFLVGLLGLISFQLTARHGLVHGKPFRPRAIRVSATRFYVDRWPPGQARR